MLKNDCFYMYQKHEQYYKVVGNYFRLWWQHTQTIINGINPRHSISLVFNQLTPEQNRVAKDRARARSRTSSQTIAIQSYVENTNGVDISSYITMEITSSENLFSTFVCCFPETTVTVGSSSFEYSYGFDMIAHVKTWLRSWSSQRINNMITYILIKYFV